MDTLQEVLGKVASGETPLYCAKHFYTPSRVSNPTKGCSDCWRVFYWTLYAKTPPDDREDFVEGMDMVVHKMLEHERTGTWDFKPELNIESIELENGN